MHEAYQPAMDDGRGIFPEDFCVKAPLGFKPLADQLVQCQIGDRPAQSHTALNTRLRLLSMWRRSRTRPAWPQGGFCLLSDQPSRRDHRNNVRDSHL